MRPNRLRCQFIVRVGSYERETIDIPVRDENDEPRWLIHPAQGMRRVDVVAILLDADALRSRATLLPVNEHGSPRKPAVLVWHRTEELAGPKSKPRDGGRSLATPRHVYLSLFPATVAARVAKGFHNFTEDRSHFRDYSFLLAFSQYWSCQSGPCTHLKLDASLVLPCPLYFVTSGKWQMGRE
jgi:hypothetical protein